METVFPAGGNKLTCNIRHINKDKKRHVCWMCVNYKWPKAYLTLKDGLSTLRGHVVQRKIKRWLHHACCAAELHLNSAENEVKMKSRAKNTYGYISGYQPLSVSPWLTPQKRLSTDSPAVGLEGDISASSKTDSAVILTEQFYYKRHTRCRLYPRLSFSHLCLIIRFLFVTQLDKSPSIC